MQRTTLSRKPRGAKNALPGWGEVSNPEEWKEVDAANEQQAPVRRTTPQVEMPGTVATLKPKVRGLSAYATANGGLHSLI